MHGETRGIRQKPKYLVLISLDGFSSVDLKIIESLPHFNMLMESGALVKKVIGIYPTLTYPLHATVITGTYPEKHGIYSNAPLQPGVKNPEWFWYRKNIQVPTLYDIAADAGLKCASVFWPTAAGAHIKYNIPEIKATRPGQNQTWLVLSKGTPFFILNMIIRFGKLLKGIKQYYVDDFTAAAASWLIRTKKPNLLLMHFLHLDFTRHKYGFQGKEVERVLINADRRISELVNASREAGTFEKTAFIVFGDHAYIDINHHINLNTAFIESGLIRPDESGRLTDWKVWANTCGGSAQVFLKDPEDKETENYVHKLLMDLKQNPENGIETVFDRAGVQSWRVGNSVDFMVEAKAGYAFTDKLTGNFITTNKNGQRATHGFRPDREGYTSLCIASGRGIKKGTALESINIIDLGPTLAALLGLEMPEAQGSIIKEILKWN